MLKNKNNKQHRVKLCVYVEAYQGMPFSSQRTNVPPRLLSLSLEVEGIFQGLMLGWLLEAGLSEDAAASSGKRKHADKGA